MAEIIDLEALRRSREAPDSDQVRKDEYGRPLYRFLLEYRVCRRTYASDVWAYDMADAEAHVAAMRESLELLGQCYSSGPA